MKMLPAAEKAPRRSRHSRPLFAGLIAGLLLVTQAFAEDAVSPASIDNGPRSGPRSPAANYPQGATREDKLDEIVITASVQNLIGSATTASEGVITRQELELRPVYRVGQLLETIPGLVVTAHSGEGKANQYFLRGFNLDHGTDLATYVDEMPVNMRTHAHGQGYTDLNFFIPELANGVRFTKGPYYASEGDFASVGSDHISYRDQLDDQISLSAGTLGDQRVFAGGTRDMGAGHLLVAGELVRLAGPWTQPDNLHKANAVLRYSQGNASDGFSVTGMAYKGRWNATNDQPDRAVAQGLIDRFGTLDPSDGGQAERYSLSGRYARSGEDWGFHANAYVIRNQLTLWNNLTHFLDDPVDGDQHAQNERRTIVGGAASYESIGALFGLKSITTIGAQARYDHADVDLQHTRQRTWLSMLNHDQVKEGSVGLYAENSTYWTPWFRSVLGAREDYYRARNANRLTGESNAASAALFQPKASLVFGPWAMTEFYVSAGRGFHSNDVRGAMPSLTNAATGQGDEPFLVKSLGKEIGLRSTVIPHLQFAATLFQIDFDSELTYDADGGQTVAGPASRRRGVEFSLQYRPFRWIELNSDIAFTRARYTGDSPAGNYIPDAPTSIASFGILVDKLGPWSGGLQFRYNGPHPLIEDNSVRGEAESEWNANIGYRLTPTCKLRLDVFNVFNAKGHAAEYFYTDRLQGEPSSGRADKHRHPLEPRSLRLTITANF